MSHFTFKNLPQQVHHALFVFSHPSIIAIVIQAHTHYIDAHYISLGLPEVATPLLELH